MAPGSLNAPVQQQLEVAGTAAELDDAELTTKAWNGLSRKAGLDCARWVQLPLIPAGPRHNLSIRSSFELML